jgi:hypothetical protein
MNSLLVFREPVSQNLGWHRLWMPQGRARTDDSGYRLAPPCGHWVGIEKIDLVVAGSEQNAEAEPVPNNAHSVSDNTAAASAPAGTTEKADFTSQLNQVEIGLASGAEFALVDIVNFLPVPSLRNVLETDWLPPIRSGGMPRSKIPMAPPGVQQTAWIACRQVEQAYRELRGPGI